MVDGAHDPKRGNASGSKTTASSGEGGRQTDAAAEPGDEGADPTPDIRKQNPGEATTEDVGDIVAPGDPHKTKKLARAGRDIDPNEGAD